MAQWTEDDLETTLKGKGWVVKSREIQHGIQLELAESVKIDLFHTGKFKFGGPKSKFKSEVEAFVSAGPDGTEAERQKASGSAGTVQAPDEAERRVFVVYGHDIAAREELELILRRVKANPIHPAEHPRKGGDPDRETRISDQCRLRLCPTYAGRRWCYERHTL